MRRVVITGMGIWSCLGTDIETVKQSLYEGKSGIGLCPERLEYGYRSGLSGIVEEPVITKQMIDRHTRAGMSEEGMKHLFDSYARIDERKTGAGRPDSRKNAASAQWSAPG